MSDRNDLVSLILGGVIVYIFLYFTGKLIWSPANASAGGGAVQTPASAIPGTCNACGGASQTPAPMTEGVENSGRYITAIAVPAPAIISPASAFGGPNTGN